MTDAPEEFYDDATSAFPSMSDLAPDSKPFGDGRLVAIWAVKNGTAKSATNGKDYGFTETVTLVLDDGPDGTFFTELIPQIGEGKPFQLDMRHSTSGLHARLRNRVDGKSKTGVPLKHRPMIGRVNTQASQANKAVAAFSIAEPNENDREIINRHKAVIIAVNKEREAAEDSAAFE